MHECTIRFRLVRASTECAPGSRNSQAACLSSTRSSRVSLGHFNVFCCILISIVVGTTFGAIPFAHVERQTFNNVPTRRACLTGWEEPVNNFFSFPVSFALIGEHVSEHAHAYIRYRTSKTMVGYHAPHVQVLDADDIKPAHQVGRELMQIVSPAVTNMLVQSGNFDTLSVPSSTTFLTPCENALQPCQLREITPKMFRICNTFTVRKSGQPVDTKINPNDLPCLWQFLNIFIEAESDKVSTRRFLDYRNRGGIAFEIPTPMNVETSKSRKTKIFVGRIPFESTTSVFGGLPISLFLIRGVSPTLSPEVEEGCLQVTQRLLGRHTGHIIQPFCFLLFFEIGEQCRSVIIADPFLFGSPSFRANVERPIVNVSATPKDFGKFLGLGTSGVESKAVSCLHTISILYVNWEVNMYFHFSRKGGNSSND